MPRKKRAPVVFTLPDVVTAYLLDMQTRNLSRETQRMAMQILGWFSDWLTEQGHAGAMPEIAKADVQGYIRHCLQTVRPMTADVRFRQLRAFFNWSVKQGWLSASPMDGMDRPKVASMPKDIFSEEELAALLRACKGSDFEAIRDTAILRVFMGTGARLGEVVSLTVAAVDVAGRVALVTGKTGGRHVRLTPKVAAALHKYLILRQHHPWAGSKALWLGQRGALSRIGVIQVIKRRAAAAGVAANPHKFRHTFATQFRLRGGSVVDLETLGGWSPNSPMTRHYGAAALAEEALRHADEVGVGEDI